MHIFTYALHAPELQFYITVSQEVVGSILNDTLQYINLQNPDSNYFEILHKGFSLYDIAGGKNLCCFWVELKFENMLLL